MDIYFQIGLWMDFKKSMSLISCCKRLWIDRLYFWQQKHLLMHNKLLMNFWQPEQQYYASLYNFVLFTNDITMYMDLSNLYQDCNAIHNIATVDDDCLKYDHVFTFKLEQPWIVIWINYEHGLYDALTWSYTFFETEEDIKDYINNMGIQYDWLIKYTVIDLSKSIPCWSKFKNIGNLCYYTDYVPKTKEVSD